MKQLSRIFLTLFFLLFSFAVHSSQDLFESLMQGGKESEALLKGIVENAEEKAALELFIASSAALEKGDRVNSAYLFYVAKFRAQFDKEVFPPDGKGGNSPMVLFGALSSQIGQAINPEIMRHPNEFKKSLKLVSAWSPEIPTDYDPGWEYTNVEPQKAALKSFEKRLNEFKKGMGDLSLLLQMPDYFEAFTVVQDYNLKWGEERPSKESYETARDELERIEKSNNIEGMFYKSEN